MTVQLQHKDGEQTASQVTVHYDNKIRNLEVSDEGIVEVENKQEANELLESHGEFEKVDDTEPDHVLAGKTVTKVEEYVRDIEDVERLKELRELEDRKTGKEAIDSRIEEVKNETPTDVEAEQVEQEDENQEESEEDKEEDGTENEE